MFNLHNPRKSVRFSRGYYEYFMTIYGHEIFEGMPKATRTDTCVNCRSLSDNPLVSPQRGLLVLSGSLTVNRVKTRVKLKHLFMKISIVILYYCY